MCCRSRCVSIVGWLCGHRALARAWRRSADHCGPLRCAHILHCSYQHCRYLDTHSVAQSISSVDTNVWHLISTDIYQDIFERLTILETSAKNCNVVSVNWKLILNGPHSLPHKLGWGWRVVTVTQRDTPAHSNCRVPVILLFLSFYVQGLNYNDAVYTGERKHLNMLCVMAVSVSQSMTYDMPGAKISHYYHCYVV